MTGLWGDCRRGLEVTANSDPTERKLGEKDPDLSLLPSDLLHLPLLATSQVEARKQGRLLLLSTQTSLPPGAQSMGVGEVHVTAIQGAPSDTLRCVTVKLPNIREKETTSEFPNENLATYKELGIRRALDSLKQTLQAR